jgi:hypothetical protein
MDVLMNGLLLAATLFAGSYCWVLARRVRDLKSLDTGLGGAIVTLTRQIELARGTLDEARAATRDNGRDLDRLIGRAEAATATLKGALVAARDIELRVAATAPVAPAVMPATERPPERAPAGGPNLRLAVPVAQETEAEPGADLPVGPKVVLEDFVPKPRSLPPLESPLRPRSAAPAPVGLRSEDELIEALSALAAGGRR